ncbi:fungal-specific transcription factor domain-containing protein [Desarmillaria tabescens]|uniref:Fungal-specific transcription factor domain-containing protein n=1 Tax=Armillaria tabescens TaxID=1929756 RepID=A0AA39NLT5_ARMTA|nr:fungal-specific transcription factor domain-containing protein [Desarmillaria tabescens]KAK0467828.1 fungal-specific transcription factor domain-containing protein [Desarmillaria tabescens]
MKVAKACDNCKRKKVKCEGDRRSNQKCKNCLSNDVECTYIAAAKMIPYRYSTKEYIEELERRLEKTQMVLRKFVPDAVIEEELIGKSRNQKLQKRQTTVTKDGSNTRNDNILADGEVSFDDESELDEADRLSQMAVGGPDVKSFGKSSGISFTSTALKIKQELGIPSVTTSRLPGNQLWANAWSRKYEDTDVDLYDYTFPEPDLLDNLVELYFSHINRFWPLLHRPTFERSLAAGLHRTNKAFAATVLMVCANGSRFSDDPRVRVDHDELPYRHGWIWFVQVHRVSVLRTAKLYDLQKCVLSVFYVQGFSVHSSWTILGTAMRMAQDLGAHRKQRPGMLPSAEEELLKRAFWVLVCMDRIVSMALGRPCAIQEEDIVADLPIDCDDEYWDSAFVQPSGVPSTMSFFSSYVKLNRIFFKCLRTIYSPSKPTALRRSADKRSKEDIIAELDSLVNEWVDSVPEHIRWEPRQGNEIFYSQSVFLYCSYYHLRILIHRPFIPTPGKPSSLSCPSLIISTSAARSISYILECQSRKQPDSPKYYCAMSIFSAAIILLLNSWSNPTAKSESKDVKHITQCVNTLQTFERQWPFAGRFCDAISHLTSGVYPLRQPVPVRESTDISPQPVFYSSQWTELMDMPFPSSSWPSSSDDAYAQNFWAIAEDVFRDTLAHAQGSDGGTLPYAATEAWRACVQASL